MTSTSSTTFTETQGTTAIIDYEMGNTGSIRNMLRRIGVPCTVTRDPRTIRHANRIILPGVGAFDTAVTRIRELGLWDVLDETARAGRVPILGICLGMQLLTDGSDEGSRPGFGWIPGRCSRFDQTAHPQLKVPHMGWSRLAVSREVPLTKSFGVDTRFYFVHSYKVQTSDAETTFARADYGGPFAAGISSGTVFGVQFHPEKSHRHGMNLLRNFASMRP